MTREEIQKIIETCFKERKGCLVVMKGGAVVRIKAGSLQPWKRGTIVGLALPGHKYTEIRTGRVQRIVKLD